MENKITQAAVSHSQVPLFPPSDLFLLSALLCTPSVGVCVARGITFSVLSSLGSFPLFVGKETLHYWTRKISQTLQALFIIYFEDGVWLGLLQVGGVLEICCCSDTSPLVWTSAVCSGIFLKISQVRSVVHKPLLTSPLAYCLYT